LSKKPNYPHFLIKEVLWVANGSILRKMNWLSFLLCNALDSTQHDSQNGIILHEVFPFLISILQFAIIAINVEINKKLVNLYYKDYCSYVEAQLKNLPEDLSKNIFKFTGSGQH